MICTVSLLKMSSKTGESDIITIGFFRIATRRHLLVLVIAFPKCHHDIKILHIYSICYFSWLISGSPNYKYQLLCFFLLLLVAGLLFKPQITMCSTGYQFSFIVLQGTLEKVYTGRGFQVRVNGYLNLPN